MEVPFSNHGCSKATRIVLQDHLRIEFGKTLFALIFHLFPASYDEQCVYLRTIDMSPVELFDELSIYHELFFYSNISVNYYPYFICDGLHGHKWMYV